MSVENFIKLYSTISSWDIITAKSMHFKLTWVSGLMNAFSLLFSAFACLRLAEQNFFKWRKINNSLHRRGSKQFQHTLSCWNFTWTVRNKWRENLTTFTWLKQINVFVRAFLFANLLRYHIMYKGFSLSDNKSGFVFCISQGEQPQSHNLQPPLKIKVYLQNRVINNFMFFTAE